MQKSDGDESDRDWGVYNKVDKKKRETLHPITKGTEHLQDKIFARLRVT